MKNELIPDSLTWKGETYKIENPITIKGGWIYVEPKNNISEIPLHETGWCDEITRLQNIGIGMANEIERQRLEIKNLKEQLAIASEQVPKGAFVFNNELIVKK